MFLTTSIAERRQMRVAKSFLAIIFRGFNMIRLTRTAIFFHLTIMLFFTFALLPQSSFAQDINDGYNPDANGVVNALVVQADGKTLIGGAFTSIAGQTRHRIARLNVDGSLDREFDVTDVDDEVFAIAVQADGRILIGGDFSQVDANTRNRIARLNADGSLDETFNPDADGRVRVLAVQPDGKLLLGGDFTTLAGETRKHIARLNADDNLDNAFNPAANAYVSALAVQRDGKLLVGGVSPRSPDTHATDLRV